MTAYSICASLEQQAMTRERVAYDAYRANRSRFARLIWMASMRAERIVCAIEDMIYMRRAM